MISGSIVWREACIFLENLYREIYGDFIPTSLTVNGIAHHPIRAKDIVRLHVEDAPPLGDWRDLYTSYVSNLPNFSSVNMVVPAALRKQVSDAVLADDHSLADVIYRLGGSDNLQNAVTALADPLHAAYPFKNRQTRRGVQWNRCVKSFAQGLDWLAGLEAQYATPADWVAAQLGLERRGVIDADRAWAMAKTISSRRGDQKLVYMGQAITLNFLKDIGLKSFVKPDTHIIGLMRAMTGEADEEGAFRELIHYANAADIWPRSLDRALWLIGSGNFHYLEDKDRKRALGKTEKRREKFAEIVRAAHGKNKVINSCDEVVT